MLTGDRVSSLCGARFSVYISALWAVFLQVIINSTITPNMTFTKTSQKFGQWADSRANTVFGLGFSSEQQLTKVTWPPPQCGTCHVGSHCHQSSLAGGWSGFLGEQSSSLPSMLPFLLGCQPGRAFRNTRFLENGSVVGGRKTSDKCCFRA